MKQSSLILKVLGVASTLILLAVFFTPPPTTAYANDPYLDANVPAEGMKDPDIEAMNQHEISWLLSQNQALRDAYQLEKSFQKLINAQAAKHGGDATSLQQALNQFDTELTIAQTVHDQAAKVIGAQFGFNAKGNVTNRQAALQTVTDSRYSLRDTHYRLVAATLALHHAYNEWRHFVLRIP